MKIKFFPIFLIIIFFTIFLIFYKGLQNSNIYTPDTITKKDIPSFETKIFDTDNKVNSKNIFLDDKFYLLNIWSSWCVPCREEHDFLIRLSKQENMEIIGLNYKDSNENARNFLNELNNPYKTILIDKNGTIAIEWGAYGVPETFLIYNKTIIKRVIGPINKDTFLEIIKLIQ